MVCARHACDIALYSEVWNVGEEGAARLGLEALRLFSVVHSSLERGVSADVVQE